MSPRTTGLLFLVAALLAGFVYWYEIRGAARREEAEELAKRIFPAIEAEAIEEISLVSADGTPVRLQFGAEGWRLVEPLEFPADEVALSGMASTLAQLASEGVIDTPQPLPTYGLGDDAPVVRFRAGETSHSLHIGKKTPVGYNTYVATGEGDKIYAVPSYRTNGLRRSLTDLRERRVLRFDRSAIGRIEASWPGGGVVLEEEGGEWRLVSPIEGAADGETVDGLLSDLSFLRADDFVDDPPPDAKVGLDEPSFRVELVARAAGEGEELARHRLAIGGIADPKYRLARGAEASLYRIKNERFEDLPRDVVAYRYKTLARFPASEAQRLDLVFQEEGAAAPLEITAERGDAGWTSIPESIAPARASRLAAELARLRGIDIVADSMGEEALGRVGLSPPRVIVRAWGAPPETGEPALLAEVHLGEIDAARGIVAKAAKRDTVYRIDYDLAEHIPVSLEAFRNRFLSKADDEEEEDLADEGPPAVDLEDVGEPD